MVNEKMEQKTAIQIQAEKLATKKALKLARASKVKGMKDITNGIYTFIYDTFKRERVPVDKFGHFYCKGGETVEDRVSPDFSDLDFVLALVLDIKAEVSTLKTGKSRKA